MNNIPDSTLNKLNITPKPPKPSKDLLLVHRCCTGGSKLLHRYIIAHPEYQYNITKKGIFRALQEKLDILYGFSIKEDIENDISGIIVDGVIVEKGKD